MKAIQSTDSECFIYIILMETLNVVSCLLTSSFPRFLLLSLTNVDDDIFTADSTDFADPVFPFAFQTTHQLFRMEIYTLDEFQNMQRVCSHFNFCFFFSFHIFRHRKLNKCAYVNCIFWAYVATKLIIAKIHAETKLKYTYSLYLP